VAMAKISRFAVLASAIFIIFTTGCSKQATPVQQAATTGEANYSRFQLVSSSAFTIALDTKTGVLCHTYDKRIDTYIPSHGIPDGYSVGHPSLDSIPLCLDLSQNEKTTISFLPQNHHP